MHFACSIPPHTCFFLCLIPYSQLLHNLSYRNSCQSHFNSFYL
ncbi:hypothetical protein C1A50_2261 [Paenibacillus polymyxa]|nr:hypothetical protein C1A50_2261 [Paenibacillus polymyxa]